MAFVSAGNTLYRLPNFQWAPSRNFHDPNPPILIEEIEPGELSFTADGAVWNVGSSSLSAVSELSFTADGAVWDVGSSSLSAVSSSVDELTFVASSATWLVDVSVALSPQVDGPVLIGTSVVPHSLFGTG